MLRLVGVVLLGVVLLLVACSGTGGDPLYRPTLTPILAGGLSEADALSTRAADLYAKETAQSWGQTATYESGANATSTRVAQIATETQVAISNATGTAQMATATMAAGQTATAQRKIDILADLDLTATVQAKQDKIVRDRVVGTVWLVLEPALIAVGALLIVGIGSWAVVNWLRTEDTRRRVIAAPDGTLVAILREKGETVAHHFGKQFWGSERVGNAAERVDPALQAQVTLADQAVRVARAARDGRTTRKAQKAIGMSQGSLPRPLLPPVERIPASRQIVDVEYDVLDQADDDANGVL